MNCIYRLIWNNRSGTFVAVSENAKSTGRKSSSGATVVARGACLALTALALPVLMAIMATNAYALPAGGVVSAGDATISSSAGSMIINQSTQNAAINWQGFDIGPTESVQFIQPDSSSVALNRVLGSDPSSILGSLSANGKVFLLNPNGILFGKDAQVSVGGLIASTIGLSDSDFMAGRYQFSGDSNGTVLNQGTITADGGYVALLGANVSNEGIISARLGTVALAAGNAVTLDVAGDGLLNVTVDQGAVNALAENGGLIVADGGQVLLTARSAGNLLQSAVNNTGIIQAQTIDNRNGTIMLMGDMQSGTVNVDGTLDASGTDAGQTGGSVTITGHHVGLFGAQINASGDAGGGTVLIGGDYQGKNPAVENASATYMSADSTINADAITNGDGGKVIVWSDDSTRAYGSISAGGGAQGGDGGLIETSGHWLDVTGIKVNTSAANGTYGLWLLDPADITISSAATSGATLSDGVFSPDSGVSSANVNVGDLVNALGSTNVTVTTENTGESGSGSGDIDVNDAITWTAPTTLTLDAFRDVNINSAITGTDGSLVANAGRDVNVNEAISTTTGDLTAIAGQDVKVNAAITVTTGNVILRADNDGTGPGAIVGGTVTITCADNCITITKGELSIRFNPVTYATTNDEILAYGLKLTGGGTLDAKAWVFGLGDDKVYDGLRDATVSGLEHDTTGVLPPVELGTVSNALFDTKDVGTEKLITFKTTFSHDDYDLFAPFGTTAGYTTRADITPAPLTVTASDATKIYGDTLTLSAFTSTGLVAGETIGSVTLTSPGTVATAPVADSPYAITPSNASGGSFEPSNYTIGYVNGLLTITPLALVGSITAADKIYDGDTSATIVTRTLTGVIADDMVSYTGGTATFSDKNVGANKTVTGTDLSLTGNDAGNYTVNTTAYTTADITPAPLTVTASDATKIYGETLTLSAFTSTGLVAGETIGSVTLTSPGTVATAPVADSPYAITPSNATGGTFEPSNYTIGYVNGVLTITPLALVGSITADDKIYDGDTSATISSRTLAGVIAGDTVSYTGGTALFSDKNVADDKTVTGIGLSLTGNDAGNYTVNTTAYTTADITPAPLTVTASDATKIYGETLTLSAFTSTGLVAGETIGSVTLTSPGTVSTAPVADSPYVITPSNATGGSFDPNNYTIGYVNGVLSITPLALVGSITAADKIYDGDTSATIVTRTLAGVIAGDTVSYTGGTATFDTSAVGTNKTVTGTGLGLAGTDAGNYTVNSMATTLADIFAVQPVPVVVAPVIPPVVAPITVPPQPFSPPPVIMVPEAPPLEALNLTVIGPGVLMPVTRLTGVQLAPPPVIMVSRMPPLEALSLTVMGTGVLMPVARLIGVLLVPPPVPVIVVPELPPAYVPPVRPPKPDRN